MIPLCPLTRAFQNVDFGFAKCDCEIAFFFGSRLGSDTRKRSRACSNRFRRQRGQIIVKQRLVVNRVA
jgi:hypothetical protein